MNNYQKLIDLLPSSLSVNYELFINIFPSLKILEHTPQDKYYHAEGDVWTHTKMVCDQLIKMKEYQQANLEEKFVLFYSCLLHDISKPQCTKIEEDGRITSKGHSRLGSIDSRIVLWKMGVPFHIRENICNIIANHQVPFFVFNNRSNKSAEFMAHKLSWELPLNLLITVSMADMKGRTFIDKDKTLDDLSLFTLLAEEENCLYQKKIFPDNNTRLKYFRSNGEISPEFSFFKETGSNVTVLCGLPASGKDTWVANYADGRKVLSFDDAITEFGLSYNDNVGKAIHAVIDRAKELLRKKEPFIWNSTNLSSQMRKKTLDLLFDYSAKVDLVYLEVNEKELKERNQKRDSSITNNKIEKMLYKWEVPTEIEAHTTTFLPNNSLVRKLKF